MLSYDVKYNKDKDCHIILVTEIIYDEPYIVASHETVSENEAFQWGDSFLNNRYEEKVCQM